MAFAQSEGADEEIGVIRTVLGDLGLDTNKSISARVGFAGPDIVSNGIALSGTAHWMFDRGLVGISDDLAILVSRQTNDPDAVKSMINGSGKLLAPERLADRPRVEFLTWHRVNSFKL